MRCTTRSAFERELIAFVTGERFTRRHGATPSAMPVHTSTPLFESGVVDSLGIFDLIAFVEDATGTAVPLRKVDLNHFGSVERISRSFWRQEESR